MKLKKHIKIPKPSKIPKSNTKLRRGFKRCKMCLTEMHIHKKVCINCQHSNNFVNTPKEKVPTDSIDIAKKIIEYSQKQTIKSQPKKIPKRFMDSIYVIKKSLLNNQQSNLDHILLQSINQDQITYPLSDIPIHFTLPDTIITVNGNKVNSGIFHSLGDTQLIYFGCAIICMAINEDTSAISIQINTYQDQDYQYFHQIGKKYSGIGCLAIIKDNTISYMQHNHGCILQVKWHPFQSLLTTINASGNLTIFPIDYNNRQANIVTKISINNQLFSCFDWCRSKHNILAIGDQQGNLYLIKILENKYEIINLIESYHKSVIKDMQFYLHNDDDTSLLVTGGYDGFVKIINPTQSSPVFNQNITSKGILQVRWDCGGKFIIVIKDEMFHRAQLISFFSVLREKDSSQTLQNTEQRFIQALSGDDFTNGFALNYYQNKVYFGSNLGVVYAADLEQVRKQAIKKEKKQSYQAEIIYKCKINTSDNSISLDTNPNIDKIQNSKIMLSDWTQGFHLVEVNKNGKLIMANQLGILLIK